MIEASKERIWFHSDPKDLERRLADPPQEHSKIVAFEPVCSIDGDIATITEICDLARRYVALT